MQNLSPIEPIDYLVIGHVTQDITPLGLRLGGTASYAAMTARALGLRVGVVTSFADEFPLKDFHDIAISTFQNEHTTTFENIYTPNGRIQYLHKLAPTLNISMVPETWRSAPIVHLGPVAQEVDPNLVRAFPNSLVGLTPQGWMRAWDGQGRVRFADWPESVYMLEKASAAVISIEDIQNDESRIEEMLASIRILAVTEGAAGARVYWNSDLKRFSPPLRQEVDATGAGDIFAAAFFYRLHVTRDPWEAGRFATNLASYSVLRPGLQGIPTVDEVQTCLTDIIQRV